MKKLIAILAATSILYTTNPISAEELVNGSSTMMHPMPTNIESMEDKNTSQKNDLGDIYKKGNKSLELSLAYGKSLPVLGTDKKDVDNLMLGSLSLRRGKMLCSPSESWMLPKGYVNNYELLYGPNLSLSGHGYFFGLDSVITTHIMPRDREWVISPLLGFGLQVNDMYKDKGQSAIGQKFVFDITAGVNVTFPKWNDKISYGLGFNHKSYGNKLLSNWSDDAGVPGRNNGLNTVFASINIKF